MGFKMDECNGSNQFGWSQGVALNMWIMNNLVPTCNVNGYKEFNIVQHQDTSHYAIMQRGRYWPLVHKFELKDYVLLQQTFPTMLDVTIGCVILHVWKVLPSRVLLLEG